MFINIIGTSIISLYTNVPNTRMMNPANSPIRNFSLPAARKTIQINKVLHVSIVDLRAAEAYLVIITPVALNPAIERMLQQDCTNKIGCCLNISIANKLSSILPLWQSSLEHSTF